MKKLTTWVDCNGQYYGSYYGKKTSCTKPRKMLVFSSTEGPQA